jgi:thioredoxin reductase
VNVSSTNERHDRWDCIVVGGGAAGLSAAVTLGRARLRTLLIDSGEPSNLVAEGIGGLLGFDGRPPEHLYRAGRDELTKYPSVEVRTGRVTAGAADVGVFELELEDGSREAARTVLLATGSEYRPPRLPRVRERWGRSVFHCPFCHGWRCGTKRSASSTAVRVVPSGPSC